jgi:hypothetical protein
LVEIQQSPVVWVEGIKLDVLFIIFETTPFLHLVVKELVVQVEIHVVGVVKFSFIFQDLVAGGIVIQDRPDVINVETTVVGQAFPEQVAYVVSVQHIRYNILQVLIDGDDTKFVPIFAPEKAVLKFLTGHKNSSFIQLVSA